MLLEACTDESSTIREVFSPALVSFLMLFSTFNYLSPFTFQEATRGIKICVELGTPQLKPLS